MGSRVVDKLRQSGVEVSRENENLVCDHFDSLPKRYALAVKDALSEVRYQSKARSEEATTSFSSSQASPSIRLRSPCPATEP